MYFDLKSRATHRVQEQYKISFVMKEGDDLYDVRAAFVQYTIRPGIVTLVWEREALDGVKTPWQRVGYRPREEFSSIAGGRVLKDDSVSTSDKQRGFVEVFQSRDLGGPLTQYADSLPHLEQMIAELEKNLPA